MYILLENMSMGLAFVVYCIKMLIMSHVSDVITPKGIMYQLFRPGIEKC